MGGQRGGQKRGGKGRGREDAQKQTRGQLNAERHQINERHYYGHISREQGAHERRNRSEKVGQQQSLEVPRQPQEAPKMQSPEQSNSRIIEWNAQEPSMTPRGSYKDVLLTPRAAPGQIFPLHTGRRSPLFQFGGGQRQHHRLYDSHIQSPMSSRNVMSRSEGKGIVAGPSLAAAPRDGQEESAKKDIDNISSDSGDLTQHLKKLREIEGRDVGAEYALKLQISRIIQEAALVINVPAGVVEMIKLHEKQRLAPRVAEQQDRSSLNIPAPSIAAQPMPPKQPKPPKQPMQEMALPKGGTNSGGRVDTLRPRIRSIQEKFDTLDAILATTV